MVARSISKAQEYVHAIAAREKAGESFNRSAATAVKSTGP